MDGQLVPHEEAQVHVLSHALHYGSSVFEGIRAYATDRGPAVLKLRDHMRRFQRSCKVVQIPLDYDLEQLENAVLDTVRENGHESCYIRPLAFRAEGPLSVSPLNCKVRVIVATWAWGAIHGDEAVERGIKMCVSSWRRMAPDTHPAMAKAGGNYLNSQLVLIEAKANGFDDGLVLDTAGYVSEGSGANLFLRLEDKLLTPPLGDSILPGITRACVIELARRRGYDVQEQRIAREMLYFADEVFVVGTAAEVTPVRSIDHKPVGDGVRGEWTQHLQEDFHAAASGRLDLGWLTQVRP